MIFDTDIFIFVQRGNKQAARLIDMEEDRCLSIQTYMELLQGARDRRQQDFVKTFLRDFGFHTIPFTENIGHRAAVYIEQYAMTDGLRAGDALIAATAAELNQILCTSNVKHVKAIRDLKVKAFKP